MFPSHTKIKFPKSEKGYLEWQWIIWVCKPSLFLKEKETLPRMKRATLGGNESTKRVSHHFSIKKKKRKKRKKKKRKRKREQEMSINEKLRGEQKIIKAPHTSLGFTFLRIKSGEFWMIMAISIVMWLYRTCANIYYQI